MPLNKKKLKKAIRTMKKHLRGLVMKRKNLLQDYYDYAASTEQPLFLSTPSKSNTIIREECQTAGVHTNHNER